MLFAEVVVSLPPTFFIIIIIIIIINRCIIETLTLREKVPETEVLAPLTFRRYCVPEVKLRGDRKVISRTAVVVGDQGVEPWYSSPAVSVDPSIETCKKAAP